MGLSKEEFFAMINTEISEMPNYYREGQKVFNAVEWLFGLARDVQFSKNIDCFYDDSKIEEFKEKAYECYKEQFGLNY